MELTDAKVCADCQRVFDGTENNGACPWCCCEAGVRVADYIPPLWKAKKTEGGGQKAEGGTIWCGPAGRRWRHDGSGEI